MQGDREQTGKRPLDALRVNFFKLPTRKAGPLGVASKGCICQLTWLTPAGNSAQESASLCDGQLRPSEETRGAYWPSELG